MQEKQTFFSQDLYTEQLSTINNTYFTNREVDVIACLLNARGTSKTAFFLSIAPRTVETHLRNIMAKLECNTRESIIDFIEASDKLSLLREYYLLLQNEMHFEKSLKDIAKLNKDKTPRCLLIQEKNKDPFIFHLQAHLELVGIKVVIAARIRKGGYTTFLLPQELTEEWVSGALKKIEKSSDKVLLLLRKQKNHKEIPRELVNWDIINFNQQENYFFSFFLILNKLLPNLNMEKVSREFKEKYKRTLAVEKPSPLPLNETFLPTRFIDHKWNYFFVICFFIILLGGGFFILYGNKKNNPENSFRSDLILPMESALLNRSDLITEIDNGFKGNKGIQTVALVGIGGAGKTTLARQYAHQRKLNLIWEINAETTHNLMESFESLAYALSPTEEDKRALRTLQVIKNASERERQLLHFVKVRLKLHSLWFLIYDNVAKFTDIQKYFPLDTQTWGEGNIILTTRDSNIQNNNQVGKVLFLSELNPQQKLDLFTKIIGRGSSSPFTSKEKTEARTFLEKIPPFPLDVSVAAYYLKSTNVPYEEYIKNLEIYNREFTSIQENILKESGEYTKTRYAIITQSLEHLIKSHKDFGEFLLFVSLLDSQDIPRDLLKLYKGKPAVDNFIYHLKKYSFITNDSSNSTLKNSSFSMHRSTQEICLAYLTKFLNKGDNQALKNMAYVLDDYLHQILEQEEFPKMRIMARHVEKFLNHRESLTDFSKGLLTSKLGSIYYFINNNKHKKLLESSLKLLTNKNLEPISSENHTRLARSLLHAGAVYTELRLDKQAQEVLERAVHLYKEKPKDNADLSWALSYLGNLHRKLGNYQKAKDCFEESIHLYKQNDTNPRRIAHTLAYLGATYRGLGSYQKSIDTLNESLALYKKHYSNDHFRVGWILVQLGNVYSNLGFSQKAKEYIENGLLVFQQHLPENHVSMGIALAYLGSCCAELGDYENSCKYFEKSLHIHQNHFDKSHVKMGWILFHLARTYKALGQHQKAQMLFDKVLAIYAHYSEGENVETARLLRAMAKIYLEKNLLADAGNLITKSLNIFQSYKHIETYRSLETLGEIYLKKSTQTSYAKNNQESENLKNQAINTFAQALKITEQHLPQGSAHIQRIRARIQDAQK